MRFLWISLLLAASHSFAQQGHSHNDYEQTIPFYRAYNAGMGSIEADVFVRNGKLFVAHNASGISDGRTLEALYLKPIAERKDTARSLQLLIDLKDSYTDVIPVLIKELQPYKLPNVRIVLSGSTPPPAKFSDYPAYILYDGRPNITYTPQQLQRVEMISDNITNYTKWNGQGAPTAEDAKKLRAVVDAAHKIGKRFRFWATKDSPATWSALEKLGVDWIGTDHPEELHNFYMHR